jgi:hypothetical protein
MYPKWLWSPALSCALELNKFLATLQRLCTLLLPLKWGKGFKILHLVASIFTAIRLNEDDHDFSGWVVLLNQLPRIGVRSGDPSRHEVTLRQVGYPNHIELQSTRIGVVNGRDHNGTAA